MFLENHLKKSHHSSMLIQAYQDELKRKGHQSGSVRLLASTSSCSVEGGAVIGYGDLRRGGGATGF